MEIGSTTKHATHHHTHDEFIGATRKTQYRMPKSLLVPSIMAYETSTLTEYNDNFFVLQRRTTTPDAPFGKSYVAKTQVVVVKTTPESCKMICSVETEFTFNPPLGMSWPIRNGMKEGTLEGFKLIAQTILNHLS